MCVCVCVCVCVSVCLCVSVKSIDFCAKKVLIFVQKSVHDPVIFVSVFSYLLTHQRFRAGFSFF